MKRNFFPSLLIIVLLFIGVGGQLAGTYQSPAYASSPISYGMWEFLAPTEGSDTLECVNWYANSDFDWVIKPVGYVDITTPLMSTLHNANKDVILRTICRLGSIETNRYTWTDIYNSLQGNKVLYNEAFGYIVNQIDYNGIGNLYAVTINEEEPFFGYWTSEGSGVIINVEHFIAVHNQMYDDLKTRFPGIKVFAFVHISAFTDVQLATLKKDGLVDDVYESNIAVWMEPWFERMMQFGGEETYCIVHASSNYATWADKITPSIVRQTAELAQSMGVPHLGWFAYDFSTSPVKSILFNNWPTCADPNDSHCSGNFKDTILDIISTTQPTPTPVTPTPTPVTPIPTPINGDTNEDGIVNSTDLTKVERIIMGLDPVTSSADVNGDGNINALDLTQIELVIMNG